MYRLLEFIILVWEECDIYEQPWLWSTTRELFLSKVQDTSLIVSEWYKET